jgi:protein phosphatase
MVKIDIDFISATDVGLVREQNEDSCEAVETVNGLLCVVCDGMGGHTGGAEASRIAVDCIVQYFERVIYSDIPAALNNALDFANLQIIGTAVEHPELQGMATTACVLLLQNDCVWLAHAGDSRIYLYEAKTHSLHRLTKDHSYVQGLIEQGIIYADEAENHPQKNIILKALGIKEDLEPAIAFKPVLPAKDDIFVLCSDGLSGMVNDRSMEKILSAKTDLHQKETALMDAAKAAGGLDNITFQLVQISHSPHKKSIFESKNNTEEMPTKKNFRRILFVILSIIVVASIFAIVCMWRDTVPRSSSKEPIQQPDSIHPENDTTKLHNL